MNDNEWGSVIRILLRDTFKNFWSQYLMWTRAYIISTACEFGNTAFVDQRIIETIQYFADALWKFYGYEKSEKAEALFTAYYNNFKKIINDIKTKDTASLDTDRAEWYRSANEISEYLASINPNWNSDEWKRLFSSYMSIVENEAAYRIATGYPGDITEFKEADNIINKMADYMVSGIIKQFNI